MDGLALKQNGGDELGQQQPKKELLRTVLTPNGAKRARMDDAPRGGIIPSLRGKVHLADDGAERSAKRKKEAINGKVSSQCDSHFACI
jgi:hypothetical protein